MKIIKYNEYVENDIRLKIKNKKYYIDKILSDAEKGILPEDSFGNKKEFVKFYKHLYLDDKRNVDYATKIATKKASDIKYYDENRKYILDIIINGLENNISMTDTIKKELPNINIADVLNLLTDEDKQLINYYHKKMSNSPENIKKYNKGVNPIDGSFNNSVIDPNEIFSDSLPYKQYSDKIKNLNN